jgi:SulP family sulfate permease
MINPVLTPEPSDLESFPSTSAVIRSPTLLVRECLAGVVTSLALVPEVISFSAVAGVDPKTSLIASVTLGLIMSVLGGRPAMVTAAAGSVALVIGPTVKAYGAQYLLPIVILAGLLQVLSGVVGLAKAMRYVPRAVMNGFVNALGVLIFCAQVPHVWRGGGAVYCLFALTLAIVLLLPRLTKVVPSPLVGIGFVTALVAFMHLDPALVGDGGALAAGLPGLNRWRVPLTLETLRIIWPAALSVAFVGLLESLLTAQLVDELTASDSNKSRESWALGVANLCAGFYGGIAGCAMIGQTVVNVQIGGARTRVSTVVAALVLLLLVTGLSPVMARIPMVTLAAVMMVVAVRTISWRSLRPTTLCRPYAGDTSVMAATLAVTVWTGNLAIGVGTGVLASFARRTFARPASHLQ